MPRLVASSPSSGRNDFLAGAGAVAVVVLTLSAEVEARAAVGHASARMQAQAIRDAETACVGRLTVAAMARSGKLGGSGGRTQSRRVRPPTTCLTADLPSWPRQPGGEAPRGAPCGGRQPCERPCDARPCARPCDEPPCERPCGERPCARPYDVPPCARPCDAPPCGRPCGARPCERPSWLCDVVPSPTLLCVGLAIPEILSGRWFGPGNESFRLYGRTDSKRFASSGRDSYVTQRERERGWGNAFAVQLSLYAGGAPIASAKPISRASERVRDTSAECFSSL